MAAPRHYSSIITLNINKLNCTVKRYILGLVLWYGSKATASGDADIQYGCFFDFWLLHF